MEGSGEILIFTLPSFIESDPGKHGRKKHPVPVDPMPPTAVNDKLDNHSKVNEKGGRGKRLTEDEKMTAKIRGAERKRQRRDERRNSKTRRSKDGTRAVKNKVFV